MSFHVGPTLWEGGSILSIGMAILDQGSVVTSISEASLEIWRYSVCAHIEMDTLCESLHC